jgi:hypothetical protein
VGDETHRPAAPGERARTVASPSVEQNGHVVFRR